MTGRNLKEKFSFLLVHTNICPSKPIVILNELTVNQKAINWKGQISQSLSPSKIKWVGASQFQHQIYKEIVYSPKPSPLPMRSLPSMEHKVGRSTCPFSTLLVFFPFFPYFSQLIFYHCIAYSFYFLLVCLFFI